MKYIIKPKQYRQDYCYCSQCDYCSIDCRSKCGTYTSSKK
nr:Clo7bot family Cys-rich peptide [uncultured Lachnoclostridium sp.]